MKKYTFVALATIVSLLACNSGPDKKVLIMGRGDIQNNGNDITMTNGSSYAEKTVELGGDKAVSWNVTTPAGKTTVEIPAEKGFYTLNLKTDTIVGSLQVVGKDISSGRTITQEELKQKIDSLTKLTSGENISAASHNYMVLPNQVKKITDNTDARVYGPFTKIPGTLDADESGKAPEIYKFYTNSGMRELIANFKKMTF